jgi:hypothetical protein
VNIKLKQIACLPIAMLVGYCSLASFSNEFEISNDTGHTVSDIGFIYGCMAYPSIKSLAPGKSVKIKPGRANTRVCMHYMNQAGKIYTAYLDGLFETQFPPQQMSIKLLPNNQISWSSSRFVRTHLLTATTSFSSYSKTSTHE